MLQHQNPHAALPLKTRLQPLQRKVQVINKHSSKSQPMARLEYAQQ